MLTYYPDQWKQLGTWDLTIVLTDTNMNSIDYNYRLVITNSPPYFSSQRPKSAMIGLNKEIRHPLPQFKDDENNPVTVVQILPPFITFDPVENLYIMRPTNPMLHLGNFLIKGALTDSRLSTIFQFSITVTNKPPVFTGGQTLKDTVVMLNTEVEINLPTVEDEEGLPFKIKPALADGSPLPSFIKYSN